jgi:DNA-binding MarR family transcriptional regulator
MESDMTKKTAELAERNIHSLHFKLVCLTKPLLSERGLTPPRARVLMQIMRKQPANMSALNLPLNITRSTLTSLVDSLVRDGFVERYRGETDRRKVYLTVTKCGADLLEEMHSCARTYLEESLKGLTREERESLLRSLETINGRLEEIMQKEKTL